MSKTTKICSRITGPMFPSKKNDSRFATVAIIYTHFTGIKTTTEITAGQNPYLTYLFFPWRCELGCSLLKAQPTRRASPTRHSPSLETQVSIPDHPGDLRWSLLRCNIYLVLLREALGLCAAVAFNFHTAQSLPVKTLPKAAHSSVRSRCQRNHSCCCLFKEVCNLMPLVPEGATVSVGAFLCQLKIIHPKVGIKFPACYSDSCISTTSQIQGWVPCQLFLVLLKTTVSPLLQKK